jgi:murein L,D-transpeptidase YcbB/YkuD
MEADMRLSVIALMVLTLGVTGCVTAFKNQEKENYEQTVMNLQSKISSLEADLYKDKAENTALKQKIAVLEKKEVRMPNAREIQTALKKAGFYSGAIDGQVGTQTKEAIKKFQEANKINPDGVVGSKTWAILVKYLEAQ